MMDRGCVSRDGASLDGLDSITGGVTVRRACRGRAARMGSTRGANNGFRTASDVCSCARLGWRLSTELTICDLITTTHHALSLSAERTRGSALHERRAHHVVAR